MPPCRDHPVPKAILTAVEDNPSPSVVNTVGIRKAASPEKMIRLPASAKLVASEREADGRVRRSRVLSLLRRRTLVDGDVAVALRHLQESLGDPILIDRRLIPNTDTFTFYKSSYSSQYISFSSNEIEDRNQQPLQSMSAQVTNVFTKYDTTPYTTESGRFPFIDIDGLYTLYTTSYDPAGSWRQGLTWSQIAAKLTNPADPVTKAIVGNANILTAATCIATGDQPSSVCSDNTIQVIEQALAQIKPKG